MNQIEKYSNLFNELKDQFTEMAQLKSQFDTEKFTVKKEGNFIAHQFHFLMRQYSLTLSEVKRMHIELERKNRELARIEDKQTEDWDLDALECQRNIDDLEMQIAGKTGNLNDFEVCRQQIIKNNGGSVPTIEDWNKEAPDYWVHQMKKKAMYQIKARETGLTEGVAEVIDWIEDATLLPGSNNQRVMLNGVGGFDRLEWEKDMQSELGFSDRVKNIEEVQRATIKETL